MSCIMVVDTIGTENLVYISSVLLLLCLPLVRHLESGGQPAEPKRARETDADADTDTGLSLFREFRHLKLIAVILGTSIVVQTVLEYQFNSVIADEIVTKDAKTAFFAQFFAVLNVVGLLIQLLLTRFILLRFGIGLAMLFLPLALITGSLGILLYPTLMVVVLARGAEGSVRYSIHEAVREVLYQPLPSYVRSKARPLIEIFGSRLFEGLAGLMLYLVTGKVLFNLTVQQLSWISISLVAIWLVAVLAVKREYLEALRNLFSETPVQSQDRAAEVLDAETVEMLIENLKSPDEVQVTQTLAMLDLMHDKSELLPHLRKTMAHPSLSVRTEALRFLRQAGEGGFVPEAEALLSASDTEARLEAVRYLCYFGGEETRSKIETLLKDADPRLRTAAIAAAAESGALKKEEVRASLEALWQEKEEESEEARAEAALALGALNDPDYDDLLMRLLRDPSPVVVNAALEGVGRTGRRIFMPVVISYLSDQPLMLYAQRTIRSYGDRVLGMLRDYLDDPEEPEMLRRAIPGCFAAIGTQRAALVLTDTLEDRQKELGDPIVEALGEMRSRHPDLEFDVDKVEAALLREVEAPLQPGEQGPETERHLRLAAGLLALIYPFEDIYRAYDGLTSGQRDLRANATELLDNLIRPELKRAILPYIEAWTPPDTGL